MTAVLKFTAAGYGSVANQDAVEAALKELEAASEKYEEKGTALAEVEAELMTVRSDLKALEDGEKGLEEETQKLQEEVEFKTSQVEFYKDGITALQRLYDICADNLKTKQKIKEDQLLETTRARTIVNNKQASVDGLQHDIDIATKENKRIREEWSTLQAKVDIMLKKQRDETNAYFGTISNDYEASREYRKYKYFSEMVEKLKTQLTAEGKSLQSYSAASLYVAIIKEKTPLTEWVNFCTTQLLREGDDAGTPMEQDDEAAKVQQMLDFLKQRARLVEERTWPVDSIA